ncbi:MAG: DUF4091 domain-containing protein [Phycisphaerales bacterium]|jgi:hypothetical protein|nr:DUF4091 domain-containing protein [Phycisphaerales bacterium]
MRIVFLIGLWIGTGFFTSVWATSPTLIDDFSSSQATARWSAGTKTTQLTRDAGFLRLLITKYQEGRGEDGGKIVRDAADLPLESYDGLLIEATNPTDHVQTLETVFRDGKGRVAILFHRFNPKEHRTIKAEFALTSSDYIDWTDVRTIELTYGTAKPANDQVWQFHRILAYRDNFDSTVLGKLRTLLNQTQQAVGQARQTGALQAKELDDATKRLNQWSEALQTHKGIYGKGDICRKELTELFSKAKIATVKKQFSDKPAVVWTVPAGTRFESVGALAQFQQSLDRLTLSASRGEYADGIVRLTNLSDSPQDWRIEVEATAPQDARNITIRRNLEVLEYGGSMMGDALVPLDEASAIAVAPGQSVEFWVRADAKHRDWSAGTHQFNLKLMDLHRGHKSDISIPMEVMIHSINLADAGETLKVGLWTALESARSKEIVAGREQTALDNLADYGVNVFDFSWEVAPWPKLSPEGELRSKPDYAALDQAIKMHSGKGKPFFLFWMGMDTGKEDNYALQNGLTPGSPQWKNGLHNWLADWTAHLRDIGLSTDDYAFYITDEPDLSELDRTRQFGEVAKALDPKIKIYADCSFVYDGPADNDRIMAVTDIWQPDERMIRIRPDQWGVLKSYPNKTLWMYDCRVTMRTPDAGIYNYYRLLTWRALQNDLTGVWYWTYCQPATGEKPWDGTLTDGSGAMLVYPGTGNSLIMSVRWELIRMALDDAKYYRLLQQTAKRDLDSSLKEKISALIGPEFDDVINHPDDPSKAIQWRQEAAGALEAAKK